MLRLGLIVGAGLSASLTLISVAGASPLPGGTHFNTSQSDNPFVQVIAPDCPIFGGDSPESSGPSGANITIHLNGWEAEVPDSPFLAFNSTAQVHGTVADADGRIYAVAGNFAENDVRADVGDPFIGTGQLMVSGPGGTIVGDATLADLGAPPEVDLIFNAGAVCTTR